MWTERASPLKPYFAYFPRKLMKIILGQVLVLVEKYLSFNTLSRINFILHLKWANQRVILLVNATTIASDDRRVEFVTTRSVGFISAVDLLQPLDASSKGELTNSLCWYPIDAQIVCRVAEFMGLPPWPPFRIIMFWKQNFRKRKGIFGTTTLFLALFRLF